MTLLFCLVRSIFTIGRISIFHASSPDSSLRETLIFVLTDSMLLLVWYDEINPVARFGSLTRAFAPNSDMDTSRWDCQRRACGYASRRWKNVQPRRRNPAPTR